MAYGYYITGTIYEDASLVFTMNVGITGVTRYFYTGLDPLMQTDLLQPGVFQARQSLSTHGSYSDLDRFNRVTSDR